MFFATSGVASSTNSKDGVCRSPSCCPTAVRSMPLADSSAAAEPARSSSSPSTV